MFKRLVALTTALVVFGAAANAATVTPTGQVSVNEGLGFQVIAASSYVKPGDKIMVAPGASATLVFENGCKFTLDSGVHTVPSGDQCQVGGSWNATHIAIGVGVIGGGVAAGVLLSGGNKGKSP